MLDCAPTFRFSASVVPDGWVQKSTTTSYQNCFGGRQFSASQPDNRVENDRKLTKLPYPVRGALCVNLRTESALRPCLPGDIAMQPLWLVGFIPSFMKRAAPVLKRFLMANLAWFSQSFFVYEYTGSRHIMPKLRSTSRTGSNKM